MRAAAVGTTFRGVTISQWQCKAKVLLYCRKSQNIFLWFWWTLRMRRTWKMTARYNTTVKTGHGENSALKVGQTRRGSLLESLVNIVVGYSINFTANLLIFPLFGWHISARENLTLGVIYTGISLVRSYGLRRFFNRKECKK